MKGRNASPEHDVEMNGWNGYVSSDLSPTPSGPRTRASERKTVKESKTDDPHESIPPPLPGIGGALKKNLKKELKDFHRGTTFEKILQRTALGAHSSLTVPSWFIEEHGDKLRQSVVLRSAATKKKWTVHLRVSYPRSMAQVKFYAGWRDFACSNGLGEGDLLVFCLREVSHFDVYMHRKADAPSLEAPSRRRRNSKLLMRPGTQSTVSEMPVAKDHKCRLRATRYNAIPNLISSSEDYPCFIKRIVTSNLRAKGYASGASLEIPNWFATTYNMQLRTSVQLQGFSEGNPVLIVACKPTVQQNLTRLYFRAGWSSFVSGNELRLGQVLVFTLTAYSFFVVKEAPAS